MRVFESLAVLLETPVPERLAVAVVLLAVLECVFVPVIVLYLGFSLVIHVGTGSHGRWFGR